MSLNRVIDEIFQAALALEPDERAAFVRARCAGDEQLERRVSALLDASESPHDPVEKSLFAARERHWRSVLDDDEGAGEDLSGQRIDAWQLTQRIARGGLATVYLARRDDGTFEQTAAFKVLRRGLDTDDLIARFRAERQILSTLDHPVIAGIIDGGALPDGRPYLVLEYVEGEPITDWCKRRGSSIEQRVKLLIDVLDALHHAHQHLIVHRDIKPSNILVSSDGRVSLLDFGIAKILDPAAVPGASNLTRTGVALLTPGYGSPEQCTGEAVTTASDIYQVGVVMHELLTGKRAFVRGQPFGDDATLVPSRELRGTALHKRVQGDLDAITAKAAHPEPGRRYGSAAEMQDDLQRYLDEQPIRARPDTLRYRLAKLARRRPWLAPVAIAGVLAVAGYGVTLTIYTRQLQIEQRRTAEAQTFLVDLLGSPDPFTPADPARGQEITVVEALDLGVRQLRTSAYDDPLLRISLLNSISSVYASLDKYESAIDLREESLALERNMYGDESAAVVDSLSMLGQQYRAIADYDRGLAYYEEALELARRIYDGDDPRLGAAEAAKARMHDVLGDGQEASTLLEAAIERMRREPDVYAPHLINALVALAGWQTQDRYAAAMASLAEALALARRHFGPGSLSAALVHAQTGSSMSSHGDYETAASEFDEALTIYEARLGPDHGASIAALNNFALMFLRAGEFERSEAILRDVVDRHETKYGTQYFETAGAYQNLATAMTRLGKYQESIPLHRKAAEIYEAVLPDDHQVASYPFLSLAYAYIELGELVEAELAARKAHEILLKTAPDTWTAGVAQCLIGLALEETDRSEEGAALVEASRKQLIGSAVGDPYEAMCLAPTDSQPGL